MVKSLDFRTLPPSILPNLANISFKLHEDFSTFDKLPVFEDFYVMKVSKHLYMLLSTVDLIFVIIIHWLTLSKNFKESKTVLHDYPEYYENFTGFRLTNALCLKFCFSPKTALHYVAPLYIQDLLTIYSPTRNLGSSSSNLLAGTFSNLKTYRVRAFGIIRIRISDARSLRSYGISNQPMNPCPEWIHRFI